MKEQIISRFLNYVSYDTQSVDESTTVPSSLKQRKLGEVLAQELIELGVSNAYLDEYGYVYGYIPSNTNSSLTIGLIAHQDTAPDASGANIKPNVIEEYQGEIIKLGNGLELNPKEFPSLQRQHGHTLITTDGTTLLGADDKAGITIIMEVVKNIINNNLPHPNLIITFTPDEEVGRGTDYFNFEYYKQYNCSFAYTIDGGEPFEINFENFNAASAHVEVIGTSIHPGSAKDKMVNSQIIGMEFHNMLPKHQVPELTEHYQGFNHLIGMNGSCNLTTLDYIIRNHDKVEFNNQKQMFMDIAEFLNKKYPNRIKLTIKDSYFNMRELILEHHQVLEYPIKAMKRLKVEPTFVPIRGGTDGARLTFNGIYTPNIGTGGYNFHGALEYADVDEMELMIKVVTEMLKVCTE